MDKDTELQRLGEAERHISDGERNITGQLLRIEKLREDGHDTKVAERTLKSFEAALVTLREHREVIVRMIEQIDHASRELP